MGIKTTIRAWLGITEPPAGNIRAVRAELEKIRDEVLTAVSSSDAVRLINGLGNALVRNRAQRLGQHQLLKAAYDDLSSQGAQWRDEAIQLRKQILAQKRTLGSVRRKLKKLNPSKKRRKGDVSHETKGP